MQVIIPRVGTFSYLLTHSILLQQRYLSVCDPVLGDNGRYVCYFDSIAFKRSCVHAFWFYSSSLIWLDERWQFSNLYFYLIFGKPLFYIRNEIQVQNVSSTYIFKQLPTLMLFMITVIVTALHWLWLTSMMFLFVFLCRLSYQYDGALSRKGRKRRRYYISNGFLQLFWIHWYGRGEEKDETGRIFVKSLDFWYSDEFQYTPKELMPIYRDVLVPLANVITPNVFELSYVYASFTSFCLPSILFL